MQAIFKRSAAVVFPLVMLALGAACTGDGALGRLGESPSATPSETGPTEEQSDPATEGPASPENTPSPTAAAPAGVVELAEPIELRQVLAELAESCESADTEGAGDPDADGARWLPGVDGTTCYQVADKGMDLEKLEAIDARIQEGQTDAVVLIELMSDDTDTLSDLTAEVSAATEPQNRLAMVVDGEVVSAPIVTEPLTASALQIAAGFTPAEAAELVENLTG